MLFRSRKHILDVTEIRNGFVAAHEGYERLRRFRNERLAKIIANEGPVALEEGPKAVLHVMPLSSTDPTIEFDLSPVQEGLASPPVLGGPTGWGNEHNYDGFVKIVRLAQEETSNYVQFFRNGAIEEAFGRVHEPDAKILGADLVENSSISSLGKCMATLKRLGAMPPFLIGLSLLGIQGYTWVITLPGWRKGMTRKFRESDLILPEILVTGTDQLPHTILRPLFDRIWNAAGVIGSPFYDEAGYRKIEIK